MNPFQIRAFAHVVREGSFVRAADRLGLTQSAVSQHVAGLEKAAGTRLLVRSRNELTPTRAGSDLFALADRYLTLCQLITEKVEGYQALDIGHLSIIANAPRPALTYIAAFKRKHPAVEISFTLWDWTTANRLLRERQADIGIITEPQPADDLIIHEIDHAVYAAYLPRPHRLADSQAITLPALAKETILLPEKGSFTARTVTRKMRTLGLSLRDVIQTTTFPLMKEAVLHGIGVGIFLGDSAHPSPDLVMRPIVEMPERYATCLVSHADKASLRAVEAFNDVALDSINNPSQTFAATGRE